MTPLHVTVRRRGPVWRWSVDSIYETRGKVWRAPHSTGWAWTRPAAAISAGEALADARSPGSGGDTPGTGSAADSAALSPVDGGREAAWSAAWLAHWREPISEHERRALRVIAGGRVTRDELARRMSGPGLDITPTGAERVLHRLEAAGLVECDRVWWCHTGHASACRPDETCGGEA